MAILIYNLPKGLKQSFLKRAVKIVLKGEKTKASSGVKKSLAVVFLGEKEIKSLNRRYLKKNSSTDVLSFGDDESLSERLGNESLSERLGNEIGYLGEVAICLAWVKKNAKEFRQPFEKELAAVLIHGVLHLLGYEHEKNKDAREKMFRLQEKYLFQVKGRWQNQILLPA